MTQYIPKALRDVKRPKRKSARQQVRECRENTINEAIQVMKTELRTKPKEWHRAYFSAITHLEKMRDE